MEHWKGADHERKRRVNISFKLGTEARLGRSSLFVFSSAGTTLAIFTFQVFSALFAVLTFGSLRHGFV